MGRSTISVGLARRTSLASWSLNSRAMESGGTRRLHLRDEHSVFLHDGFVGEFRRRRHEVHAPVDQTKVVRLPFSKKRPVSAIRSKGRRLHRNKPVVVLLGLSNQSLKKAEQAEG